jgi:hypothetical protein
VRSGKKTAKGYRREDFLDAWERFLGSGVEESHQSHQSHLNAHAERDVTDVTDVTDGRELAKSGDLLGNLLVEGVDEREARVIAEAMESDVGEERRRPPR